MASSRFDSCQFPSEEFVESAGAVLFRLSTREGRRSCGETRQATALREVTEETESPCRLLPINLRSRAPPAVEAEPSKDEPRLHIAICEPFTLQLRRLREHNIKHNIKLIWWFIAAVDEDVEPKDWGEEDSLTFSPVFCNYTGALERLTFQMNRDMAKGAINLVASTYEGANLFSI
ncbi:hypothetical protein B0H67DRAFT_596948 [Lasiosphaeris hirsuta]|uniref:Nudix hydrolase domain-containing protein n=1 Tax=Lasiosphaeris hirsuta TaxID=260670 RepID=A0AA40EAC8_9PEZI|nr:hypothetical protein B0H67DRAFT_596948 [Lasiosphaeris hirsuta]